MTFMDLRQWVTPLPVSAGYPACFPLLFSLTIPGLRFLGTTLWVVCGPTPSPLTAGSQPHNEEEIDCWPARTENTQWSLWGFCWAHPVVQCRTKQPHLTDEWESNCVLKASEPRLIILIIHKNHNSILHVCITSNVTKCFPLTHNPI